MQACSMYLFVVSGLLLISASAVSLSQALQRGRFYPIKNVSDPHVKKVARFAVKMHNEEQNNEEDALRYLKVLEGWYQVVAGINYRLIIATKPLHRHNHNSTRSHH